MYEVIRREDGGVNFRLGIMLMGVDGNQNDAILEVMVYEALTNAARQMAEELGSMLVYVKSWDTTIEAQDAQD